MSKKTRFHLFLAGSGIGIANLIPGISGATIALFFGLYEKLLDSLSAIIKNPKQLSKQISFLLPIIFGAFIGITSFSYIIDFSLKYFPTLFKCLLLFSVSTQIPFLWKRYASHFTIFHYPFLIAISILVGLLSFFFLNMNAETMSQAPNSLLIASGFFGASALILPGLSGSLIFVLMGTYPIIIEAIKTFNIPVLFTVSIGALLGLSSTVFILKWLLKHLPAFCYVLIFGLVFGAFVPLWPTQITGFTHVLSLGCILAGIGLGVRHLKKTGQKKKVSKF